jgi:axial budding pattern protein 2
MFIVLFVLSAHILTLVLASSSSSVSVLFPLDSQYPPIARVGSPYAWIFAERSFESQTNKSLVYSTSPLPAWLVFDPATRTFSGTPAREDEGTPRIKVLATDPDTSDSAASFVSLCITPYAAPDLAVPVASQFRLDNPSLSSVFLLSDHSALTKTEVPTLRIPSSWSFSIGFDGNTFTGPDGIRYAALQADGTPLPPWMQFDSDGITLDGVAPPLHTHPTPYLLELVLHASDQFGFSAASVPFNVVVASRELHLSSGLPTINITKSSPFDIRLNSPMDFAGVMVDNAPMDPQDVASVVINTSSYDWLHYDTDTRRLFGQLQNDTVLSVVLTTVFNQTLDTQLKLAAVPSFFSQDPLPSLLVTPDQDMQFGLQEFFSNATQGEAADLTPSYDPSDAATHLSFDTASAILSGTIPSSDLNYSHITVSFTAYSRLTHSISHTTLPISLTSDDYDHRKPSAGSQHHSSRRKLALGLGIALGLLGGVFGLSLLLATLRGCAHPPDPALSGAAAARAMTENERRWYGIGQPDDGYDDAEKGYTNGRWGELGLGLSRTMTMTRLSSGDENSLASPGQLSKAEFLGRIRSTVRKVSNRYRPANKSSIGRPVLVQDSSALSTPATPAIPSLAGYEPVGYSGTASSLRGSPSSSTGERSIPQRRADFAPPRQPQPTARRSRDSVMSLASDSSTRSHAIEAVVHRAARARSVRSVDGSGGPRARMVPFTAGRATAGPGAPPPARASSLSASVVRVVVPPALRGAEAVNEADELDVGMRYVRALGEDAVSGDASGSFSSLESSHPARSSIGSGGRGREVLRVLVRVGERFRFRLPVRAGAGAGLVARRMSGELMPAFLYADLDIARGDRHRDTVKFWGVPRADDVGEVHVGVYTANGVCVAQAVIEVLVRSS